MRQRHDVHHRGMRLLQRRHALQRCMHQYAGRPEQLRRLRESLRGRASVLARRVLARVRSGSRRLQGRLHESANRPVELRSVR
jgi:hypothetical protein